MAQEFFINSQDLENKVRQLLPSQGGLGAGFDLSASTQIIPIIDLTESAEGSNLRADLQTSLSHGSITSFSVNNTASTLVNNTGYYRVFGTFSFIAGDPNVTVAQFRLNDGASTKIIWNVDGYYLFDDIEIFTYDFNVFLGAGDSLECESSGVNARFTGCTRQIATIDGTLVNPN